MATTVKYRAFYGPKHTFQSDIVVIMCVSSSVCGAFVL